MDRRKALESLGIASGVAFIPLSLEWPVLGKQYDILECKPVGDGEYEILVKEIDELAGFLKMMYPEKNTYIKIDIPK